VALIPSIAIALSVAFTSLSLMHVYWLLGGPVGRLAAIPEIDGKPVFQPSAVATFVVAAGLALCTLLLVATAGMVALPLSKSVLVWLPRGLALGLLLRAMGDFRLVGFFKCVRHTRFACLDTAVYSPLCLVLAIGAAIVSIAS
jgi:hypothetical protein